MKLSYKLNDPSNLRVYPSELFEVNKSYRLFGNAPHSLEELMHGPTIGSAIVSAVREDVVELDIYFTDTFFIGAHDADLLTNHIIAPCGAGDADTASVKFVVGFTFLIPLIKTAPVYPILKHRLGNLTNEKTEELSSPSSALLNDMVVINHIVLKSDEITGEEKLSETLKNELEALCALFFEDRIKKTISPKIFEGDTAITHIKNALAELAVLMDETEVGG